MKLEKIKSYKKLDEVIANIVIEQPTPVTASQIGEVLNQQYHTESLYVSNRAIAMRLRGNPNIRVIPGLFNKYTKK